MNDHIDIVFDGPPAPESGHFVEVEDSSGHSIRFGEWVERPDGYWVLRIPKPTLDGDVEAALAGVLLLAAGLDTQGKHEAADTLRTNAATLRAHITAQQAEIAELYDTLTDECGNREEKIAHLQAALDEAREALEQLAGMSGDGVWPLRSVCADQCDGGPGLIEECRECSVEAARSFAANAAARAATQGGDHA